MNDIDPDGLLQFEKCSAAAANYLRSFNDPVREILGKVRLIAQDTLPQYRKRDRPSELPETDIFDPEEHELGDFAYCYEKQRNYKEMTTKWYVGWGFRTPKTSGGKSQRLEAFVYVVSGHGPLMSEPSGSLRTSLKKRGWRFITDTRDSDGDYTLFKKTTSPRIFLKDGFSPAAVRWFSDGIEEAAGIVRFAKRGLKKVASKK